MRDNAILMFILGIFFLLADITYTVWALIDGNFEPVGTVGIGLAAIMAFFPGYYFWKSYKAAPDLPEDRLDAKIEDGDYEIGFFVPSSWWPIVLAAACGISALGLAIGIWLLIIGLALVIVAVIGWSFETNRNGYAH